MFNFECVPPDAEYATMNLLKGSFFIVLILLFGVAACETDPVIYDDHSSIPVIYGILSKTDTIHYIKVGRSFGAIDDPALPAACYDSLYFEEMKVQVKMTTPTNPTFSIIHPKPVNEIPKDSGLFAFPGQVLYQFEQNFRGFNGHLVVEVEVPGLPTARAEVSLVNVDSINTPKKAQQYVYLVPSAPLLVQWKGNPWNEIDIAFEFIEDYGDSVFESKWVHIQNDNYFDSPFDKYREMKITYDEFIREILLQIQPIDSVKQVFLGYISLTIHGGDENMVHYMKYLYGYNDFNVAEFSNIENGIGLLASRSSVTWDSLRLDYSSRQALINENRLKILKISPWN